MYGNIFDNKDILNYILSFINDDTHCLKNMVACNKYINSVIKYYCNISCILLHKSIGKLIHGNFYEYMLIMSASSFEIEQRLYVLKQFVYYIFSKNKLYYFNYDADYPHSISFGLQYKNWLNLKYCTQPDTKIYKTLFQNLASLKQTYPCNIYTVKCGKINMITLRVSLTCKALIY